MGVCQKFTLCRVEKFFLFSLRSFPLMIQWEYLFDPVMGISKKGDLFMNTSIIATLVIVAVVAAIIVAWYLQKTVRFSKGSYGKSAVKSTLKRFALTRNYKVLENVQMQLDGQTQTIDFVLVGFFGLLFVSALQGKGDFYGDFKEPHWTFVDNEKKVRFDNPAMEMDKKLETFRRLMARKKVYNLKVDSAVVISSTKSDIPMYLSHVPSDNIVMSLKEFKKFLGSEKFEKDNGMDVEKICDVLSHLAD